jgi:hypothetical protein
VLKKFYITVICIIAISCINYRSKEGYKGTYIFPNYRHLYVERYRVFNGSVFVASTDSYYLTDSTNFRKFIGSCEDNEEGESYHYKYRNDTVFIEKTIEEDTAQLDELNSKTVEKMLESKCYSLNELRKAHKFD